METSENNIEKVEKPTFEVKNKGNLIIVKGSSEIALLDLAIDICVNICDGQGEYLREREKGYLLEGDELRPGGVWAVRYDRKKQEIWVQNRNAFGNNEYNEKMLAAVTTALN